MVVFKEGARLMRIAISQQGTRAVSRKRLDIAHYLPLYLSIAPFYLLFIVFGLFPLLFSLYLAFHKWDGIGPMQSVGWNQFAYLLSDGYFWQSLLNTVEIWLLSTIPMLALGLVMAFVLSLVARARLFYQISFLLPHVTSMVAIAIIFGSLFGNRAGLLNALLAMSGLPGIEWLSNPWGIKITIATMIIWRGVGYCAIIYLAGLQSIPGALYEAARIDGAGAARIFWHITVPLLKPVILFTVITATIGGLQVFSEPQVLFGGMGSGNTGGPGGAGMTIVLYLYQQAFEANQFGYGAAIGLALFGIIVLFSIINWQLVQRPGMRV